MIIVTFLLFSNCSTCNYCKMKLLSTHMHIAVIPQQYAMGSKLGDPTITMSSCHVIVYFKIILYVQLIFDYCINLYFALVCYCELQYKCNVCFDILAAKVEFQPNRSKGYLRFVLQFAIRSSDLHRQARFEREVPNRA